VTSKKWFEGLKRGDQATHIYRSEAEQQKVITDLIAWMTERDKLAVMTDRWDSEQDFPPSCILEAACEEGRLEVLPGRRELATSHRHWAEALSSAIYVEHRKAREERLTGLIFVWDLDWASRKPADFDVFLEHQSKMALSALPRDLTVVSQYNLSSLSEHQVERVRRISPLVLEDGQLNRNFWVVTNTIMGGPPPDDHQTIRSSDSVMERQS
jgi:hypothetical protein